MCTPNPCTWANAPALKRLFAFVPEKASYAFVPQMLMRSLGARYMASPSTTPSLS